MLYAALPSGDSSPRMARAICAISSGVGSVSWTTDPTAEVLYIFCHVSNSTVNGMPHGGKKTLHCTVGWRAGGLFAIENYLLHDASKQETLDLAAAAHMSHAVGDVEDWIELND